MIIRGHSILKGGSGKLGDIVVKQYGNTTIVTAAPKKSRRKLSERQKETTDRMRDAIRVAKIIKDNARLTQRACETLNVPANKVFRALVKKFLVTQDYSTLFEETEQDKLDKQTLASFKELITTTVPDAVIKLFGDRAKGVYNAQSDWDILILTTNDYPSDIKWELQEKLFGITLQQGTRVNLLLAQKDKWLTQPEYEALRKRVGEKLVDVK